MTKIRRPINRNYRTSTLERKAVQISLCLLLVTLLVTITMLLFFMPTPKKLIDQLERGQRHHHHHHRSDSGGMHGYDDPHSSQDRHHHFRDESEQVNHDVRLQDDEYDDNDTQGKEKDFNLDLFPFQKDMNESTKQELRDFVKSIRKPFYETNQEVLNDIPYDIYNCPNQPPPDYPYEYPLMHILKNWNPNNTTFESLEKRPKIYAAICRFDASKPQDKQKAFTYRKAEVPFILRDDPTALETVQRWNTPGYLSNLLNQGENKKYKNEYSESNHLMFFRPPRDGAKKKNLLHDWEPPMSSDYLTYDEFVEKASQSQEQMGPDHPHWYFRVNAKAPKQSRNDYEVNNESRERHFLFDELPFFRSIQNFFIVDPKDTRGINCRFGMSGNIAEAHFDGSRNFVMIFGGERRYVLSHPKHCPNLALYPSYHPSARHSELNWADPDIVSHPEFEDAKANEVVLQAGDALYLPTHWFHFIISLDLNWQCNARSGITDHYKHHIRDCGFA